MFNDLAELIKIKSVKDEPCENAPFGKGCREALDWFLDKAREFGLSVGESEGYCGWAEYGEGETCIGVLCHLDVVPAGDGWSSDPYSLLIENGKLYGRGVADDKGSVIMCLHALKEIKDSGIKTKRRIRIIVGCDEEHGSSCIKHYVEHCEIPTYSFVPDSDFPVINSEKGILHLKATVPLDKFFRQNVAYIHGGESINVVPDTAAISLFNDSPLAKYFAELTGGTITREIFSKPELVGNILAAGSRIEDFSVKNESKVVTFETTGTAGHAMCPQRADNAVWKLFLLLNANGFESEIVKTMNEYFCTPLSAEKLNIYKCDEESGDTTISMGMIDVSDSSLHFTLDIRLPISADHEEVKRNILAVLPAHSKLDVLKYAPNLYIAKENPLVTALLEVYSDVTGEEPYCLKCGGGTYARELPNAVAFGPTFPDVETNLHKADENFGIADFEKAMRIYKEAMLKLARL